MKVDDSMLKRSVTEMGSDGVVEDVAGFFLVAVYADEDDASGSWLMLGAIVM